jgi:exopolysaccharide production protein ExoZ
VSGWLLSSLAFAARNWTGAGAEHYCVFCHIWSWPTENLTALAKSLFFIPYINASGDPHPLLGVGWTLNLEIFFYLIFAASLRFGPSAAPLLACAALIGVKALEYVVWPDGSAPLLVDFYAHPYTTYFILGVAVFYVWRFIATRELTKRHPAILGLACGCLIVFFFMFETQFLTPFTSGTTGQELTLLALPPLLVLAALVLHSIGVRVTTRLIIVLGDASYALYLLHTIVYGLLSPLWRRYPATDPSHAFIPMAIVVAACCILAIIAHYAVEKPMIAWLRGLRSTGSRRWRSSEVTQEIGRRHEEPIASNQNRE